MKWRIPTVAAFAVFLGFSLGNDSGQTSQARDLSGWLGIGISMPGWAFNGPLFCPSAVVPMAKNATVKTAKNRIRLMAKSLRIRRCVIVVRAIPLPGSPKAALSTQGIV